MSLLAAVEAILPRLRQEAEARMTSRCAIMRNTGDTTTVSGLEVPEWATVDADSPLRLAGSSSGASPSSTQTLGLTTQTQAARRTAHLPRATADLADGDLIEITVGECAGLVFRVIESDGADQQTALRVPVEATQRPEEWA